MRAKKQDKNRKNSAQLHTSLASFILKSKERKRRLQHLELKHLRGFLTSHEKNNSIHVLTRTMANPGYYCFRPPILRKL